MTHVCRVVLTGGPCSGKTSGLEAVKKALSQEGYLVYTTPEAATLLHSCGAALVTPEPERAWTLQTTLIDVTLTIEHSMLRVARSDVDAARKSKGANAVKGVILICDRGALDGAAYCTPEAWNTIARVRFPQRNNSNRWCPDAMMARYEHVLHMTSVACDAPQFYRQDNNAARSEGLELAKHLDAKTLAAWQAWAAPKGKWQRVDNAGRSFEAKLQEVVSLVRQRAERRETTLDTALLQTPLFPGSQRTAKL